MGCPALNFTLLAQTCRRCSSKKQGRTVNFRRSSHQVVAQLRQSMVQLSLGNGVAPGPSQPRSPFLATPRSLIDTPHHINHASPSQPRRTLISQATPSYPCRIFLAPPHPISHAAPSQQSRTQDSRTLRATPHPLSHVASSELRCTLLATPNPLSHAAPSSHAAFIINQMQKKLQLKRVTPIYKNNRKIKYTEYCIIVKRLNWICVGFCKEWPLLNLSIRK